MYMDQPTQLSWFIISFFVILFQIKDLNILSVNCTIQVTEYAREKRTLCWIKHANQKKWKTRFSAVPRCILFLKSGRLIGSMPLLQTRLQGAL